MPGRGPPIAAGHSLSLAPVDFDQTTFESQNLKTKAAGRPGRRHLAGVDAPDRYCVDTLGASIADRHHELIPRLIQVPEIA